MEIRIFVYILMVRFHSHPLFWTSFSGMF